MYLIKRTTFLKYSEFPKDKILVDYIGSGHGFTGFQLAKLFHKKDAQSIWRKLIREHHEYCNQRILEASQPYHMALYTQEYSERNIAKWEQYRKSIIFELVLLTEMVMPDNFLNAFPLNDVNIPDYDRDVQFVYRDGSVCGVVTNFLRKEMLKGNYVSYNPDPDFVRWKYIEDSYYLKYKKQSEGSGDV